MSRSKARGKTRNTATRSKNKKKGSTRRIPASGKSAPRASRVRNGRVPLTLWMSPVLKKKIEAKALAMKMSASGFGTQQLEALEAKGVFSL